MKNKFSILKNEGSGDEKYIYSPWNKETIYQEKEFSERLEHELLDLEKWLQPTPGEKHLRLITIMRFTNVIETQYPGCVCIPQGSSSNGTYLPTSDIDLIVLGLPEDQDVIEVLQLLTKIFWKSSMISNAHIIPNASVPITKLIERPYGFQIDICVSNINGALNISRVQKYITEYHYLRPLLIFLKLFTFVHKIDDPSNGGFGSNQLLNIALFIIQSTFSYELEKKNLGDLLLFLFDVLGNQFNYFLVGFSTVGNGSLFSKWRLDQLTSSCPHAFICEDPQFHNNFVGGHTSKSLELAELCRQASQLILHNDESHKSLISALFSEANLEPIIRRRSELEHFYIMLNTLRSEDFGRLVESTPKRIENKYEIAKAEQRKAEQRKAEKKAANKETKIIFTKMKSAGQKPIPERSLSINQLSKIQRMESAKKKWTNFNNFNKKIPIEERSYEDQLKANGLKVKKKNNKKDKQKISKSKSLPKISLFRQKSPSRFF